MKKTLLAAATLAVLTASSQGALVDGLVNYWSFDGNLNDTGPASTSADNGTFGGANGTGGISYAAGRFGQGISLDGAAGAAQDNGHVVIPRSVETLFGVNATNPGSPNTVSSSLWVRIGGDDTDWQTIMSHGEGNQYRIAMRGGSNVVGYAGGSGEGPDNGPDIGDGQWHNVIAISDGAAGNTRLYIDGVLSSVGGAPAIDDARGGGLLDFFIGANPDTGAQTREWFGEIDEFNMWNRVLTDVEIGKLQIPEPSASMLIGLAGFGLMLRRRRR